jgi:hypothetical protein
MATFEQLLDWYESWHLAIIADSGAVCTRATAAKLMEVSTKAQENGEAYALDQAMNAAEKVAANPRSRNRLGR